MRLSAMTKKQIQKRLTPNTLRTLRHKYEEFERAYRCTDKEINWEGEAHVGKWKAEEMREIQYKMGYRDAMGEVASSFRRILGVTL